MMKEEFSKKPIQNIVLQDDGIHESAYPVVEEIKEQLSADEIHKRKEIINKIKSKNVDNFWIKLIINYYSEGKKISLLTLKDQRITVLESNRKGK